MLRDSDPKAAHFSSVLIEIASTNAMFGQLRPLNKNAQNLPRRNVVREYIKRTSKRTSASTPFVKTVQKFIPRTLTAFARHGDYKIEERQIRPAAALGTRIY